MTKELLPFNAHNMDTKIKVLLALLVMTTIVSGCERLEPTQVQSSLKIAASEAVTYKTRGYTMQVELTDEVANITTNANGNSPQSSAPMLVEGPNVPELKLTGEIVELPDENQNMVPYNVVDLPNAGGNYWLVPFADGIDPVKVHDQQGARIIILLGACNCDQGGCFDNGLSCIKTSGVDCSCGRDIFLISVAWNDPGLYTTPFALVDAPSMNLNGVLYE